jgi:hypothetical protein
VLIGAKRNIFEEHSAKPDISRAVMRDMKKPVDSELPPVTKETGGLLGRKKLDDRLDTNKLV